jgi:DNA-directed RNA polymerases I, II, and III subunit RPABC1
MSVNKLFKSRGVIVDMIELRSYDVAAYSNFSVNEIETMFKASEKKTSAELGSLDITVANKLGSKLYVKYLLASKLRVNNFKSLIDEMINDFLQEGDEMVFVLKDKINNMDSFNNMLESYLTTHNIFIQIFCLDNLMFNITNHMLVPTMRVVSPEDKDKILESYSAKEDQMPKILKSDPHAKFLGVRKGDLCQITRASETAGTYISYRLCV